MSDRLRRLVVLYETEDACRQRLAACGYPREVAEEIAFYLRQASDFAALVGEVEAALSASGIELRTAGLDDRDQWLPWLTAPAPGTMLWSLTDGFAWYRGSFSSSMAGLLDLPQFGSPPAAQHLCQDKFRCLAIAAAAGMTVPPTALVEDRVALSPLAVLPPDVALFVKPNTLGAKLGIDADSRVSTLGEALERCHEIWRRYGDRALIQPYLPGRDVRVSFMDTGAAGPRMGIHAVRTHDRGYPTLDDSRRMTAQRASDSRGLVLESLADTPAGLSIATLARQVERVMGLRDYWSVDLRLAEDGTIWFLEFEVCPAVTIYDFLTYLAEDHGLTLPDAIVLGTAAAYRRRIQAVTARRPASA